MMNKKIEFTMNILKQYSDEKGIIQRSTSDLSPLEEYLILKLLDTKSWKDKEGNYYSDEQVIYKDINTMACQFMGYVTKESVKKSHCINDWVRVEKVGR